MTPWRLPREQPGALGQPQRWALLPAGGSGMKGQLLCLGDRVRREARGGQAGLASGLSSLFSRAKTGVSVECGPHQKSR